MAIFKDTIIVAIVAILSFLTNSASANDLFDAAKARDVKRGLALLNAGADPNERSPYDGPLHVAAKLGPPEMVIALLEAGADFG